MLINARELGKTHGVEELFSGVTLGIRRGDRVGVIGPNGAGKSTLLKIIAGQERSDSGEVIVERGARCVYVPQRDEFADGATVRSAAAHGALRGPAGETRDAHECETIAEIALGLVGFERDDLETPAASLSGGWRKRLSMAAALASCSNEPDALLLDEPTNHLDLEGIEWLGEFLGSRGIGNEAFASLFVTHDRQFLETVATRVVELSRAYPGGAFEVRGNYSEFLRRKREFLDGQAKAAHALAGQGRRDLAWLSRGAKARRTKEKGRIRASEERSSVLSTLNARNTAGAGAKAGIGFDATERRTKKLIVAEGIAKSMGGRELFRDVSLTLGAGDCLGLLGANGSGKTTLIRVLTGVLEPDAGEVVLAEPTPRVGVFTQRREEIDPGTTLRDALAPVSERVEFRGQSMHVTAWAKRFLFRESQLTQPIGSLSGGELARVHLARMMVIPADVLVLDEPTNDLDIPTLEMLEEALEEFTGALILVTHDRAMLDRLSTEVLSLDGAGGARTFATIEQAMAARRRDREPAEARRDKTISASATRRGADAGAIEAPVKKAKKLTYKLQREYDQMEATILEAEGEAELAQSAMDALSGSADHSAWAEASERLTVAQRRVAELYARWEELEAMASGDADA